MPLLAAWIALRLTEKTDQDPEISPPTYRVERLRSLRMRTRDGATLVADGLRPAGRGRFPAILERTLQGRTTSLAQAEYWARRGYVYIAQDCRGRGDSGGVWTPFLSEGRDGFDAVAWLARQPWCDGNVALVGTGYAATAAWLAAIERPPALRCIVPRQTLPDTRHGLPYECGTFNLEASLRWSSLRADGGGWTDFDYLTRLPQANVPALHVSGWFDKDQIGTMLAWQAMRRGGRKDQWIVYAGSADDLEGEGRSSSTKFDLLNLELRFLDAFLNGDGGMNSVPIANVFVVGADRWVSLDGWPASTSSFETLYLGDGSLEPSPRQAAASVYVYDPTKNKGVTKPRGSSKATSAMFKSAPLEKATAITGPFECRLFFKSSARDTDLFATLVDISATGAMRPIGPPGRLKASYREDLVLPAPLKPGRIYSALLRPLDAAYQLEAHHRLGLIVSGSPVPASTGNAGTGDPLERGRKTVAQRNVILTGTVTPSRITFRKLW